MNKEERLELEQELLLTCSKAQAINKYIDELEENAILTNQWYKSQQENKQLKELYRKTCEHLFNIGNDELARYFQAQINECPTFTTQILGDKE